MTIHWDIIQGTIEWHKIRRGLFTASKAGIIANQGRGLENLIKKIHKDRNAHEFEITEGFSNYYMNRGINNEPIARLKYSFDKNVEVTEVGFITHNEWVGISPDGLIFNNNVIQKGIEIKTRIEKVQERFRLFEEIPWYDYCQMQLSMFVSKTGEWDYISFCPHIENNMIIKTVERDEKTIIKILEGIDYGIAKILAIKN